MKTALSAIAAALALSGCVTAAPPIQIMSTFSSSEVAWFKEKGTGSIKASALLRQNGGGVVTCAGREMTLFPESAYANERMFAIYKSNTRGYYGYQSFMGTVMNTLNMPEPPPEYRATSTNKVCDPQGFATFSNLPAGNYYIVTEVAWSVPNGQYSSSVQGGMLMQKVTLGEGEAVEIVLTN